MADRHRITESKPRTGALPSEQEAKKSSKRKQNSNGMFGMNKLIYELVEGNVQFANEQFGENLKFNSETLANVLYDNIYKLIGDKLNEDQISEYIADQIIQNGGISQIETSNDAQPVEEPVQKLDSKNYDVLVKSVQQSIDLLNQKKVDIFKELVQISEQKTDSVKDETVEESLQISDEQNTEQDYKSDRIKLLTEKMYGNRVRVLKYIESQMELYQKIQNQINGIKDISGELSRDISEKRTNIQTWCVERYAAINQKIDELSNIRGYIDQSSSKSMNEGGTTESNIIQRKSKDVLSNTIQSIGGNTRIHLNGEFKDGGHTLIVNNGKIGKVIYNKNLRKTTKLGIGKNKIIQTRKPSLIKRVGGKIGRTIKGKWTSLKNGVKNSFIGKSFRALANVGKKVLNIGKKVLNAAKMATVAFLMASHFIGKKVVQAGAFVGRTVKNAIKKVRTKGFAKSLQGGVKSIIRFSGAKIVTKLGIKSIKFVGRKIWKGIKKLGLKMIGLLGRLFNISIKFANKIGYYASRIGGGIKDKTYRFLIRPIASLITTLIGFTISMVMIPAQFMKQIIPAIIDRTLDALNGIKQSVVKVLKSSMSIFKRILFNPITIALLIGGLFYFFGPKLISMLTVGVKFIRENIVPPIVSFAKFTWKVLKGVWEIVSTVGKTLFNIINWITSPEGIVAGAIRFIIKTYMAFKRGLKWLLKMAGKSSIDALCMMLSGDLIGMVIFGLIGAIRGMWRWIKRTKIFRIFTGVIDAIVGFFTMYGKVYMNIFKAVIHPWDSGLIKHPIDTMKKIFKPISEWIGKVKNIFTGAKDYEVVDVDPIELNANTRENTKSSIRNLKMKGMNGEKVLAKMDGIGQMLGGQGQQSFLKRLEWIGGIYEKNSKQVEFFNDFIQEVWNSGNGNADQASKSIKVLLESPELSQKLLSAFYYRNPQNGKLMSTMPVSYIEQFLDNIRKMVFDDNVSQEEKFKTIVEAFDQANKERGVIVNKQGEIIQKYADSIRNFDLNQQGANDKLMKMVNDFNKGDLFKDISATGSFKQINEGGSKTQQVTSVTGSELGTNKLFKFKPLTRPNGDEIPVTDKDMEVKIPKKDQSREPVENIVLPESLSPKKIPDRFETDSSKQKSLREQWFKHQETRADMFQKGMSQEAIDKAGFRNMTYDEFIQKYAKEHPPTEKQVKQMSDNKARRLAGLRLSKDIQAYNSQGKVANKDGFNLGRNPSILSIETDGLTQTMLMYSPQWRQVQGASTLRDDELLLELDAQDRQAAEKVRKAKEEAARKKDEEERERKRQQEILDYSAKVEGGYIEVKIGEDETAMRDAWLLHMDKRSQAFKDGISQQKIDEMGLKNYTWEEWKRYYRRMHGLPEDGIKRIKFEGKRQERKIDWSTRSALSKAELEKYGIQMSKDGPVMIPLDKALEASKSIMSEAKTIHSIRDGLEIMKQGLDTETQTLKKKREGGMPFALIQNSQSQGETTNPVAPTYEGQE